MHEAEDAEGVGVEGAVHVAVLGAAHVAVLGVAHVAVATAVAVVAAVAVAAAVGAMLPLRCVVRSGILQRRRWRRMCAARRLRRVSMRRGQ